MNIERLPSGAYRVRKQYKGKRHSLIFDHKPTQKEVIEALADRLENDVPTEDNKSFDAMAKRYLETKSNILSPATIRGYRATYKLLTNEFRKKKIADITQLDIQIEMNHYAEKHSPKSVRNAHGFVSAVLHSFRPNMTIATRLPAKIKKEDIIPTDEEVKAVIEAVRGSQFYVVFMLATCSLRRSEICALELSDLKGNYLTVSKAFVQNSENKFVTKPIPKTTESYRTIYIPDVLVKAIQEQGYIYKGHPSTILKVLHRTQVQLGLPQFKLHSLRKYYASMAHSLGVPDSYIMEYGGWSTDFVLKDIYRRSMRDKKEEMHKFAAEYISEVIN